MGRESTENGSVSASRVFAVESKRATLACDAVGHQIGVLLKSIKKKRKRCDTFVGFSSSFCRLSSVHGLLFR